MLNYFVVTFTEREGLFGDANTIVTVLMALKKIYNKLASFKKGIRYVGWQNIETLGSS